MAREIDRRTFVGQSALVSAGAAMAALASAPKAQAQEPAPPDSSNALPKGRIGKLEVSEGVLKLN